MNSTKTKLMIAVSTFLLSLLIFGVWKASEMKLVRGEQLLLLPVKPVSDIKAGETATTYEKVICTCEVGSDPSSPVEIAEVKDFKGNVLGVAAHIYKPDEVHLIVEGAKPQWDHQAVSADSTTESIRLLYRPDKQSLGYDWVLMLKSKGIDLKQKVRNCSAVSDE